MPVVGQVCVSASCGVLLKSVLCFFLFFFFSFPLPLSSERKEGARQLFVAPLALSFPSLLSPRCRRPLDDDQGRGKENAGATGLSLKTPRAIREMICHCRVHALWLIGAPLCRSFSIPNPAVSSLSRFPCASCGLLPNRPLSISLFLVVWSSFSPSERCTSCGRRKNLQAQETKKGRESTREGSALGIGIGAI